ETAVGRVPEMVQRARLDDDDVAGPRRELLVADGELALAVDDLEALRLVRVDVRRGEKPARVDGDVDQHVLASRLRRGLEERDVLTRDGVHDGVSLANHPAHLTSLELCFRPGQARSRGPRSNLRNRRSDSRPIAGVAGQAEARSTPRSWARDDRP